MDHFPRIPMYTGLNAVQVLVLFFPYVLDDIKPNQIISELQKSCIHACSVCNLFCQVATQLISAAMVIYAMKNVTHASTSAVVLKPWFIALVAAGAIERLAGLALGVAMERDWVVLVGLLIQIYFIDCVFPLYKIHIMKWN